MVYWSDVLETQESGTFDDLLDVLQEYMEANYPELMRPEDPTEDD